MCNLSYIDDAKDAQSDLENCQQLTLIDANRGTHESNILPNVDFEFKYGDLEEDAALLATGFEIRKNIEPAVKDDWRARKFVEIEKIFGPLK
eukprot:GHVH01009473.1.p1 GENE.GHVH01009473.1~~GHVH01009473.1.p1  ORF type:complete len:101 (+),score=15.62 GHVH01009473.1:29-304(+)